jgi:predicted secreted Zn-dependent protease
MTEVESSLLLGLVAGFVLALIFTGMWFVAKIEEYKQAHETITTNYAQFMEKKLQHTAIENYCKGLSQARMIVKYLQRKDFMNADIACDAVLMKIGEKMKPAEDELEIRHKILKEHNHHV